MHCRMHTRQKWVRSVRKLCAAGPDATLPPYGVFNAASVAFFLALVVGLSNVGLITLTGHFSINEAVVVSSRDDGRVSSSARARLPLAVIFCPLCVHSRHQEIFSTLSPSFTTPFQATEDMNCLWHFNRKSILIASDSVSAKWSSTVLCIFGWGGAIAFALRFTPLPKQTLNAPSNTAPWRHG